MPLHCKFFNIFKRSKSKPTISREAQPNNSECSFDYQCSDLVSKPLDSEVHPNSSDSDYVSEISQTDSQQVTTNTPKVTPINYTSDDEQELKTHLNSVYRLLLKKRFSNSDILSFSPRLLSINQFKPPNQNGSVAHNLYHRCGGFWGKAKRVFDDIVKDCSAEEDKTRLIQQVKRTPDHLIDQEEKDLIIMFINNQIDESEFGELLYSVKSHIDDLVCIFCSDIILAFLRDSRPDFTGDNGYNYANSLITEDMKPNFENLIYQLVVKNIGVNFDKDLIKGISKYLNMDYSDCIDNYLNRKLGEIYSFCNFKHLGDGIEDKVDKPITTPT